MRTSQIDADYLRNAQSAVGAVVVGRRLFDFAQGWGRHHPLGVPVLVVTHSDAGSDRYPSATFVTSGVADALALAEQVAGTQAVAIASPTIAQQCLEAGILDETTPTSCPYCSAPASGGSTTSLAMSYPTTRSSPRATVSPTSPSPSAHRHQI